MKYLKILVFVSLLSFYSFINAFDINSILPVKQSIIDKTNTLTETEKNSINLQIEDIRKKQCQYCNKRHHDASDEWNRAMSANQNKHAMVPHSRYIAYSPYGRRIQK